MTDSLTLRRPDDWHVHLRDGAMLAAVAPYTARQFARAIVMPNLTPPVISVNQARQYRERIRATVPSADFTPLMTCYLTDDADPAAIVQGYREGVFAACKLYPAHATTNSGHGVSDIAGLAPVFAAMEKADVPLLIHGEVTDPAVDIFDREAVFVDRVLTGLINSFPGLRIVLEHVTTAEATAFVAGAGSKVAATITPQHLHLNRNALFDGGLRPHAYCLPVLKHERHRAAVVAAATSGDPSFFLGTDSAPHAIGRKEAACGCAGIFNAPFALESYAAVFDAAGALDRLEAFASENGARFYGLPLNEGTVTLVREPVTVPEHLAQEGGGVVPFHAGNVLGWRLSVDDPLG